MSRRAASVLFSSALAVFAAACGARTGLRTPDVTLEDAALDVPALDAPALDVPRPDAPPPDVFVCRSSSDCNDGFPCTQDRCNLATGACVHTPFDLSCEDGVFCNGEERCVVGTGCVRTPRVCADTVACTQDRCDETLRRCVFEPDAAQCPLSHGCDPVSGCFARAMALGPTGIYDIRLPSGEVTRRGNLLQPGLTDIALRPDGLLYVIGPNVLYRIDINATMIQDTAGIPQDFTAMDAAPDGTLYAGAGIGIYRIDIANRVAVRAATYPVGFEASGDLAFLQGRLLASARTGPDSLDTLMEVDLTLGTMRAIGSIGHGCVWGLAAFGETLYGLSCEGKVIRIDPATGAGTVLTQSSFRFYGATAR